MRDSPSAADDGPQRSGFALSFTRPANDVPEGDTILKRLNAKEEVATAIARPEVVAILSSISFAQSQRPTRSFPSLR